MPFTKSSYRHAVGFLIQPKTHEWKKEEWVTYLKQNKATIPEVRKISPWWYVESADFEGQ